MDNPEIPTIEWCFGAGGNHLGLRRVIPNLRLVALSEIEAYACANLVAKMEAGLLDPAPIWTDCRTFPCHHFIDRILLFIASYPCQPFSHAGLRLGFRDPRNLWPHIRRAIAIMRPLRLFFENVEGHISKGLKNVLRDLETLGYRHAEGIFSAEECGASHRRKRIFILGELADAKGVDWRWKFTAGESPANGRTGFTRGGVHVGDAESIGWGEGRSESSGLERRHDAAEHGGCVAHTERGWPSQSAEPLIDQRGRLIHSDEAMADASGSRLQGHELRSSLHRNGGGEETHGSTPEFRLPIFPPGPGLGGHGVLDQITDLHATDPAGAWRRFEAELANTLAWKRILEIDPSLEPALCRMADGLAHRVDRLRLTGNGVVPHTAALAWLILNEKLKLHG